MLHERGTPRPLFLVGAGLATAAVAVLAAFADLGALYPVTILAGLAFGAASGPAVPLEYRLKRLYPRFCIHSSLTWQLSLSATACRSYLCGSCIIWLA